MTTRTESKFTRTSGTQESTATGVMVRGVFFWRRLRDRTTRNFSLLNNSVSAQGWLVIGAVILGTLCGLVFGWIEFMTAALIAGVLLVFAIPFLFGAKSYKVELFLEHDRIVAGDTATGKLVVENMGRTIQLPGTIDIPVGTGLLALDVPFLRGGSDYTEPVSIPGYQRGIVSIGPARAVRRDPLGMLRRERTWQYAHTLYIHPKTVSIPTMTSGLIRDLEGQASRTIVPDDLSFHAIREYQAGDSRRHVHWKSTAKTGTLMVRQYEETRRSDIIIALATREEEFRDPEEFELAVSVAGSLGLRGIRDGRQVQCTVSGEIPEFARAMYGRVQALRSPTPRILLDELSDVVMADRRHTLPEVAKLAGAQTGSASIAFLVGGSGFTAREVQKAALAFPPEVVVITVLCDRQAEPSSWNFGGTTVLSVGILDDLPQLLRRGVG